jgi:hypothetical protein
MLCPGRHAKGEGMVEKIHDVEMQRCRDAQYLYKKISSKVKDVQREEKGCTMLLEADTPPPDHHCVSWQQAHVSQPNKSGTSVSSRATCPTNNKTCPCSWTHDYLCSNTAV